MLQVKKVSVNRFHVPFNYRSLDDIIETIYYSQTDKIIWSFWNSKKIPKTVHMAFKSWKYYQADYVICLLDGENLSKFLSESELPVNFSTLSEDLKSAVVRLALLDKFGGIWLDPGMLMNQKISQIWDPKEYDLGGYQIDDGDLIESSCLSAPRNSPLIHAWKAELFYALAVGDQYYLSLMDQRNIKLTNFDLPLIDICYAVVTNGYPYLIRLISADSFGGPMAYLKSKQWKSLLAVVQLMSKPHNDPLVNLRSHERNLVTILLPFARKGSMISALNNIR